MSNYIDKYRNWIPYQKRFVAFLDILGFTNFALINEPDKVLDRLRDFKTLSTMINSATILNDDIYVLSISDSIILFSKDDSAESFKKIKMATCCIVNDAATGFNTLITGALAYGDMYIDVNSSIIFGEAYIKAYKLQNYVHYAGVVCDNSIDDYIAQNGGSLEFLFKAQTKINEPKSKGTFIDDDLYYNLTWFGLPHYDKNRTKVDYIQCFYTKNMNDRHKAYIDNTITMYERFLGHKK